MLSLPPTPSFSASTDRQRCGVIGAINNRDQRRRVTRLGATRCVCCRRGCTRYCCADQDNLLNRQRKCRSGCVCSPTHKQVATSATAGSNSAVAPRLIYAASAAGTAGATGNAAVRRDVCHRLPAMRLPPDLLLRPASWGKPRQTLRRLSCLPKRTSSSRLQRQRRAARLFRLPVLLRAGQLYWRVG